MSDLERLLDAARAAREQAHAPYSGHTVGAAILGAGGSIHRGCNVENAAYPEGCCAETSAIAAMVLAGERGIEAIAVVGPGEALCTPCGGCRQRIREFAEPHTPIYVCGDEGLRRQFTLDELLPHAFGPENLSARDRIS